MTPMKLPMAPLHSLGHQKSNEVQYDFLGYVMPSALPLVSCDANTIITETTVFLRSRQIKMRCNMTSLVMWHHWCWYHVMVTVSLMIHLHSLGQDDWNEVQHYFFGHVMQLVLASVSHDVNGIANGTTAILRSRLSKWGATWCFAHLMPWALVLPSHNADRIINGTTGFLRSRQSKWGATWLLWSCATIGASVIWHRWHYQWHHCIL